MKENKLIISFHKLLSQLHYVYISMLFLCADVT